MKIAQIRFTNSQIVSFAFTAYAVCSVIAAHFSMAAPPPVNPATRITFDYPLTPSLGFGLKDEYHPNANIQGTPLTSSDKVIGQQATATRMSFFDSATQSVRARYFKLSGTREQPAGGLEYDYSNGFSLSIWLKPSKLAQGYMVYKGSGTDIFANQDFFLAMIGDDDPSLVGGIRFGIKHANSVYEVRSAIALPNLKWSHVVVTCGSRGLQMYINGVLSNQQALCPYTALAYTDNGESLYVDTNPTAFNQNFLGSLDELLIYERQLTASEIANVSSRNYIFLEEFDSAIGTSMATVVADRSAEDVPVTRVGADLKHVVGFDGNALSFSNVGTTTNTRNYLKISSGLTLVGKRSFTIGILINPTRNLTFTKPEIQRVMSQNIHYDNGTEKGVFEIAMVPHPTSANINVMRFKLNISGTMYSITASKTRVNPNSWGYFQFSFDGRCMRIKPGGTTANGAGKCIGTVGQTFPIRNSSFSTLPIVIGGGWKAKIATPTAVSFDDGFSGRLDDIGVYESGSVPRTDTICPLPGVTPVTISATPIFHPTAEVVRYKWKEYNPSVHPSQYNLLATSLTGPGGTPSGFDFGADTTSANCYYDSQNIRVCEIDLAFNYSNLGPYFAWKLRVAPGAGICHSNSNNYSAPREFQYVAPQVPSE